jgi:hypothetical protein
MAEIPGWHISGDWFDNCSCAVACPCTFAQAPDNGFCESVLFWHIRRGHYGDINLDDLSFVRVGLFRRRVRLQVPMDDEFEQAHSVRLDRPLIDHANFALANRNDRPEHPNAEHH